MSLRSTVTPTTRKRALAVVLASVLIDMMGIGIIIPVLPEMIRSIAGSDLSQASVVGGWLFVAYSAMQFVCGPAVGNLSDAYGRRPVLLASILGLGIDYLVTAFAPSIAWLFVGRIVAGALGASYTTANAYVADIAAPEDRARAFGLIGAAFGIGFILGPAIGGLLGHFGNRVPFLAAAACSIVNFAIGYFVLAQSVYISVWAFAAIARYGWNEVQIGISLALVGISSAVVQGVLVGPVIARLGEGRAALVSLGVACLSAVGYAVATEGWMVYALILLGAFQGIAMPAINALMSHEVTPERQGELQGAVASLQGIGSILGPLAMTQIFAAFTGPRAPVHFPGAPFAVAAALFGIATLLLVLTGRRTRARYPS